MQKITLYSDGACSPNPGVGGYAAIMVYENTPFAHLSDKISKGFKLTTNNRMELLGVIEPLESLEDECEGKCDITVVTDSQYVANAVNQGWIKNWSNNNWQTSAKEPVKNQDLWARMIHLLNKHDIKMQWVRGHSEHPENKECDSLAVEARQRESLFVDEGYNEKCETPQVKIETETSRYEKFLKECINGHHKLTTIYRNTGDSYDVYIVVRWCSVCGAVVVDTESDGRTYPGRIKELEVPEISRLVAEDKAKE